MSEAKVPAEMTGSELAGLLGCNARTIRSLASRGIMQRTRHGRYKAAKSIRAYVVHLRPLPTVSATQYLLQVNEGSGPPGSTTSVHTHPGSEAYYVLAGEVSQKTPHGVSSRRRRSVYGGP